jgi:predicted transposase/invertase (TIGR01784 family)
MTKLEYTFKTDTLFKMLFVEYPDLLKHLVAELLGIRIESIGQFQIINPDIPPENIGEKFCRLDINMTVDEQRVNLEIQVRNEGDYPERIMYHWARDYSSSLAEGQNYSQLPRTIIISIIDFNLFDCEEFHSEFLPLEATRHTLLTDKMSIHFYELRKLPVEIKPNDTLILWLSLFKANTMEEIENIKALGVPVMEQAITAYQRISVSPEFREIERLRSKASHDEAQALFNARQDERKLADIRWQGIVADKDARLADKDAEIARLREKKNKK